MPDKRISQLTPTTTVDLADQYAIARGTSNFHVSYNTLKTELSVNTSSFVKTVNAVAPDSVGNVTVSLTAVETGTSASMRAYSSSGLFTEGDVWVISGESGSASGSNGDSYIYSGENTLLRLSGPDTAANDARYVNVSGDTMTGDLILNGAPTTNNQAATKAYVDSRSTNGTNGQTIRFNGTTQTANSFLYNSGTQVAVGTTSPDAGRVFTVSDETSGDPQVQIHGGTTQATSPGLEFEGSTFGGVLWMDSTDGNFNFGARSGFPDRSRRVSAADPVDSYNLTTKQYVDSRGTTGTNGQTIRFSGTTPTANSVLFNNGTNVAVGNTSPKSTDKFTVTDGGDTRVRIGRTDLSSPDRDFLELRSNFESGSILSANEHLCLSASSGANGTICLDATTRVEFNTSQINANTQIKQVTDPTADQDAATKAYVDGLTQAFGIAYDNRENQLLTFNTKLPFQSHDESDSSLVEWDNTNNQFILKTNGVYIVEYTAAYDDASNTTFQFRTSTSSTTGATGGTLAASKAVTENNFCLLFSAVINVTATTYLWLTHTSATNRRVHGSRMTVRRVSAT